MPSTVAHNCHAQIKNNTHKQKRNYTIKRANSDFKKNGINLEKKCEIKKPSAQLKKATAK